MTAIAAMSPMELAGFISEHLSKHNIYVVLSGGACVAYYSKGKYVSMDLDFVNAGIVLLQFPNAWFIVAFHRRSDRLRK